MSFVVVITRAFCSAAEQNDSLAVGCLVVGQPAPLRSVLLLYSIETFPFYPCAGPGTLTLQMPFAPQEVFWGLKKNLSVVSAKEKEVDGVSFFQQLLCIMPFVFGLIVKLYKSSKLGSPC